jgi:Na+/alanine symporter
MFQALLQFQHNRPLWHMDQMHLFLVQELFILLIMIKDLSQVPTIWVFKDMEMMEECVLDLVLLVAVPVAVVQEQQDKILGLHQILLRQQLRRVPMVGMV